MQNIENISYTQYMLCIQTSGPPLGDHEFIILFTENQPPGETYMCKMVCESPAVMYKTVPILYQH